jgi:diguanylate cyclase (GGDEF)-like protein
MNPGRRILPQRALKPLRALKLALIVITGGFFFAAVYISMLVVERQDALKEISRYNPSWEANQAFSELTRLAQRLSEFGDPGSEVDRAEVEFRYEIFLSRTKMLKEGSFQPLIKQYPDQWITFRRLEEALTAIQPLITNLEHSGNAQEAVKILKPLEVKFAQLASIANTHEAELVTDSQRELIQLHWRFSGVAAGLILFGALLLGLLDRQLRLLERARQKMYALAHQDALTDLANRVLLHEQLEQALAVAEHQGRTIALLCIDLDRFKEVNDSFGHQMGDALLKIVADRLRGCVWEGDLVARLGGDEFAVLQVAAGKIPDCAGLASHIIDAVGAPYDIDGQEIVIGVSVGIAMAPEGRGTASQLMKQADMALYQAKADGRGRFRFFEQEMDAQLQARRALEIDLRKALANGEFELFYQPQINIQANEISGFEALLRWRHPEWGLVSPGRFIPIAEDIGLITSIGDWVIEQACREAVTWPEGLKVAVNLSPMQFRNEGLVRRVRTALAQSGLDPRRLELEITETTLLQDNDATVAILHQLRQLGVRFAMDDFGTGYSSLSYLRSFPFDKIKIDQSFVQEISSRSDCLTIVQSIASLGAGLDMSTVAEGVETEEQYLQLRSAGFTEVQGYYFGRPKPARELAFSLSKQSDIVAG